MSGMVSVVPPVVAALESRSLGSDEDRAAWLEARRSVITATEAKQLAMAPNATARKRVVEALVDEKLNGSKFSGNHFTHWGTLREPVIIEQLSLRYGLRTCGLLVHAEDNPRHAATPDAVGVNFDGLLDLAEIKTSKNDLRRGLPGFDRAGYWFQMQWQMRCTGARRVLYVLEQHDDDWSRWDLSDPSTWLLETGPRPLGLAVEWVERDDEAIAQMVGFADQALLALDAAIADRAAGVVEAPADVRAVELMGRVLAARKAEAEAVAEKKAAWDALLSLGGELGDFSAKAEGLGSVKFTAPVPEEVPVPDVEAAVAAEPKQWAQLERARKRAAELEAAWEPVQAAHMKTEIRVGKPSLTVSAARAKEGKKK